MGERERERDSRVSASCCFFKFPSVLCSQGAELIRVSRFYKEGKEGKFVSFLNEDTRTLYDGFRRGAKESSECP